MSFRLRLRLPRITCLTAVALVLAPGAAAASPPLRTPAIQLRSPAPAPEAWVGTDKALHFTAAAALAGGGYALGALGLDAAPGRLAVGAGLAFSAGAAKEALDAAGLGTPSWRDLAWDVAGIAFGLLLSASIDYAARPAWFGAGR